MGAPHPKGPLAHISAGPCWQCIVRGGEAHTHTAGYDGAATARRSLCPRAMSTHQSASCARRSHSSAANAHRIYATSRRGPRSTLPVRVHHGGVIHTRVAHALAHTQACVLTRWSGGASGCTRWSLEKSRSTLVTSHTKAHIWVAASVSQRG